MLEICSEFYHVFDISIHSVLFYSVNWFFVKAWYFFSVKVVFSFQGILNFYDICSWPLKSIGSEIPTPYTVEYLHITLQLACGSASITIQPTMNHVVLQYVIFTERNICESEPVQFKPMLFRVNNRDFLYIYICYSYTSHLTALFQKMRSL